MTKLYFPAQGRENLRPWMLAIGVIIMAVGIASTTPLFDACQVEFFPFSAHQKLIEQWWTYGFTFHPR